MQSNVHFENFGKIQQANIQLRPFTLIAGPNSSGKSFITKALYCAFQSMQKDRIAADILSYFDVVIQIFAKVKNLSQLTENIGKEATVAIEQLGVNFALLRQEFTKEFRKGNVFELSLNSGVFNKLIHAMKNDFDILMSNQQLQHEVNSQGIELDNIDKLLNYHSYIQSNIKNLLHENFQKQSLHSLINRQAKIANINFNQQLSVAIGQHDVKVTLDNMSFFNQIKKIIYLESPIYWKIKKSLEFTRRQKQFSHPTNSDDILTGIPQHFYDLVEALDTQVKITEKNQNDRTIYEAIEQEIGGELGVSDLGDIYFEEHKTGQRFDMHSTASGIINIGLIALLLKRHVLTKGSILFIDEPELNLHPRWQKVMMETLYRMSKSGIYVVIASHSIDMMKTLETIMDDLDSEEIAERFAINQMNIDGISVNEDMMVEKKLASIKTDLAKPFYDMFMENNW